MTEPQDLDKDTQVDLSWNYHLGYPCLGFQDYFHYKKHL